MSLRKKKDEEVSAVFETKSEEALNKKAEKQNKSKENWRLIFRRILLNKEIYLMLLPVVIFYIVFSYVPMYGITLAWKDYWPSLGIQDSPWIGWGNFQDLFELEGFWQVFQNTITISLLRLLFTFPIPILVALLLNEIFSLNYKKTVQTMIYLPHFISWVILGSLVKMILAEDGMFNNLITLFGGDVVYFLQEDDMFYSILLITEIWKDTGWGTIIYTASIAGIDGTLYEAAKIDGCKRADLMFRITVPMLAPIITVMFINGLSSVMNAGFDPIYNLYNKTIYEKADVIDTYVYRLLMDRHDYALSTAVGIFKTSINFLLLIGANVLTKKINGYSMFVID